MTRDAKSAVRQEAIDRLKVWIKPGDTLFTQLKSVSRSGMSRVIQVIKLDCSERELRAEGRNRVSGFDDDDTYGYAWFDQYFG